MRNRVILAGLALMVACADHNPTSSPITIDRRTANLSDALDPGFYWRDADTLWIYDRKPEAGVGTHSADDTAISRLKSLNVRLTRHTLWISDYQNAELRKNWIGAVANMCAQGLKPVIVVDGTAQPSWRGWFPAFMNGAVADNPCVQHWQLWNEPDQDAGKCGTGHCVFGTGSPYSKGVEYAAMLIETYPQIKSANPNALVLTAGVNFRNGPSFLDGVYAGGGRKYFDIVGVHPYGGATAQWDEAPGQSCAGVTGAGVRSYGQCYQNLFAAHGDQGRILWSTEFGVGAEIIDSSWGRQTAVAYDTIHRQWWIDALAIASNYRHYQKMIGYQLVDGSGGGVPTDGGNPQDYGFGIIRPGGAWRPAAYWLQSSRYNDHALQYESAAGNVTVYAPGKRPIGYSYTRAGDNVTFYVSVNKLWPTKVAFEPDTYSASISGPTKVRPFATCTWNASASGGTPPYTFDWVAVSAYGSGEYFTFTNDGGAFTVKLTVTDARGLRWYASENVTVSSTAMACLS